MTIAELDITNICVDEKSSNNNVHFHEVCDLTIFATYLTAKELKPTCISREYKLARIG